jgi:hypothetical protein
MPSLRLAMMMEFPASISTYVTPGGRGGTSHAPASQYPQTTTWPSLRRATVKDEPAETST